MPSIKGRYEWDDDNLSPSKKKEGGLHQNLFDRDGNLKASARFIPEDLSDAPEPIVIYDPVDDEDYDRRRAREQDERAEAIAYIAALVIVAAPHAQRLWHEKARPAIEARKAKRAARKARKQAQEEPAAVEATVVDSSQELASAADEYRTRMTSEEALARYLAALAARSFSDEQMKLVANAIIIHRSGPQSFRGTLPELPPQQVRHIIETAAADPAALDGVVLAELGNILRRFQGDEKLTPIDPRTDQ